MTNAERFLNAYASIEKSLNEINNSRKYIPFSQLLVYTSKQNRLVSQHYEDLKEYNELRNAIVHKRDGNMEVIAIPSDKTVENIEHIAEVLESGKYALNYASKPVLTATLEEDIISVYNKMKDKNISKLPIYKKNTFYALVTMDEIAGYFLNTDSREGKISSVIQNTESARVYFMNEKNTISDVITLFEKCIKKKESIPFIIITKNGNEKEVPLGIISTSDLATILSAML